MTDELVPERAQSERIKLAINAPPEYEMKLLNAMAFFFRAQCGVPGNRRAVDVPAAKLRSPLDPVRVLRP